MPSFYYITYPQVILDKKYYIWYTITMKDLNKENLTAWVIFRVTPSVKKLLQDKKISKDLSKQVRHLINKFLGINEN